MDIEKIRREFEDKLNDVSSLDSLEKLSLEYLGRKGKIRDCFSTLSKASTVERRSLGAALNELKKYIEKKLQDKRKEISKKKRFRFFDPSLERIDPEKGSLHPITYTIEKISRIFSKIGFVRMSYPEVEWEYYAFEALNMPKGHPARDEVETFFIDYPEDKKFGRLLLSPHTSSSQVQEMKRVGNPPVRMINIAKCYRPNWDTTHTPMFHQFEGLCIDKGINITHLKGTIDYFVKNFFGKDRQIRLRPYDFRFTEPSFEIDISCAVCAGKGEIDGRGCRVCKSGWLELGGAGLVHPFVLKSGGINPDEFSGWAFGFGVERVFLMREGLKIDDIRIFYSGDLRFLSQF